MGPPRQRSFDAGGGAGASRGRTKRPAQKKPDVTSSGEAPGAKAAADRLHLVRAARERRLSASGTRPQTAAFERWLHSVFQQPIVAPGVPLAVSWEPGSPWGNEAQRVLLDLERQWVRELVHEIRAYNIPGDLAVFAVFESPWMHELARMTEEAGLRRRIWAFENVERRRASDRPPAEGAGAHAGVPAQPYAAARAELPACIVALPGRFEQSLKAPEPRAVDRLCFARVDCDRYEAARECLAYIGPRLVDGAIVAFGAWPQSLGVGSQRAFEEWTPTVGHLRYEFLFYGCMGHFYMRVHYRY